MTPIEAALHSPSSFRSVDARLLIVEDEAAMAALVANALRGRGYDVAIAESGETALVSVSTLEPDVVVLDLGLPDIDGVEVCRRLRRWFRNPIVVLSADGDEERKVLALEEGADDYVTKPFSMRELLARLDVALRHRDAVATALDPTAVAIGDLYIDEGAHEAAIGGSSVRLSRKEFSLLAVLARNAGRVLTHDALLSRVWGTKDPTKTETLRVHVNQLRRKLGEGPDRPRLLSEPGVGYRLVAPGSPSLR